MKAKRQPLSPKIRFEVFKRDSFKCQYCGSSAPDVILHVDHITPVSQGGENKIINLVTSCTGCNSGKGARTLDDQTVIKTQKKQLDDLNEKRLQLEMLMKWHKELENQDNKLLEKVCDIWSSNTNDNLDNNARQKLKQYLAKFGLEALIIAIRTATTQYLSYRPDGSINLQSVDEAFNKIGGILRINKEAEKNPAIKDMYYAKGVLRKRGIYIDERLVMTLSKNAVDAGYPSKDLIELAKSTRNWTQFRSTLEEYIQDQYNSSPNEANATPLKSLTPAADERTKLIGHSCNLQTDLTENYEIPEEDAEKVTDALGTLCERFSKYISDQFSNDYSLLKECGIYEVLKNFFCSPHFQDYNQTEYNWRDEVLKVNELLIQNLQSEIPFGYLDSGEIKYLIFGNRRQHDSFKKFASEFKTSNDDNCYCAMQQRGKLRSWDAAAIVHLAIKELLTIEFKLANLEIDQTKLNRILKYTPYSEVLNAFRTWTTKYDEDGNEIGECFQQKTWTGFLCELSVQTNPDHELILKEGSAEEYMEIFEDCSSFATAYAVKNGFIKTLGVHTWDEYKAIINEGKD